MFQVAKRDGAVAEFELSKITEAIRKAFEAKKSITVRICFRCWGFG